MRYNWPGNIRELENAIERAVLLTEGPLLTSIDLRLGELSTTQSSGDSSPVVKIPPTGIALEEIERQALIEALKMSNWVQKDAAELLAISPRVMNYKIKTLGIDYARTTPDGGIHGVVVRDSRFADAKATTAVRNNRQPRRRAAAFTPSGGLSW